MKIQITPDNSWQLDERSPSLWIKAGTWPHLEYLQAIIAQAPAHAHVEFAPQVKGAERRIDAEFRPHAAEGVWEYSLGQARARYFVPGASEMRLHPAIFWEQAPLILKPALFLDRDGILNLDRGYVYRFEDIEWVDGIFELIQTANQLGLFVFVVTNQGGIAYGNYTEADVLKLHQQMDQVLRSRGAIVDDWVYAPTHAGKGNERYRQESLWRKPYPGMMMELAQRFGVDLLRSIMVGDKPSDHLYLQGPEYLHLAGEYDLSAARAVVYQKLSAVRARLEEKFS